MKILIVDDDRELAIILQVMLEEEGYEVQLAHDSSSGYVAYLLFSPDLVITDIQMPGKNGLELMAQIRLHNPYIRTIYMSGDHTRFQSTLQEENKRYQALLLKKPFFRLELLTMISQMQGQRRKKAHQPVEAMGKSL